MFLEATQTIETPTGWYRPAPLTTKRKRVLEMAKDYLNRATSVYKVTNTVTDMLYFGITVKSPATKRWQEHVWYSKKKRYSSFNGALQRAIRNHGEAVFTFEVIYEAVNVREACSVEKAMIAQYGTLWPLGYNLTSGGDIGGGGSASPATCAKISAATMGKKKMTQAGRERLRQYRLGRKWSEESKAKASASKKGKKWTEAQRASILPAIQSAEYRAKMGLIKGGKPSGYRPTEERKRQISEEQTARMASPEARHILSEMAKAQHKDPEYIRKWREGKLRKKKVTENV
jgi:group I intron endonuclease